MTRIAPRRRRRAGFTIIELMVSMTIGLLAISALYTLGSSSTQNFHRQFELATTQARVRNAFRQLQSGIARAGFLGTPNADLEDSCETATQLPPLSGASLLPLGAIHYYSNADATAVDPLAINGVVADRIRVLANYESTEQFTLDGEDPATSNLVFDTSSAEWGRTFETAAVNGGTQWSPFDSAFHDASWLHFETPNGKHFFRRFQGKTSTGDPQSGYTSAALTSITLPIGSTCIPRQRQGHQSLSADLVRIRHRRPLCC